jgi:CHAD domain-containing protein
MKNAAPSIAGFANEQTATRLGRVVFELRRARRKADEDAVHDLRVSIRRFTQALRVFPNLLPEGQAKKIRKRLRPVMKIAGEVRNLDIAAELVKESKIPRGRALIEALAVERRAAQRRLKEALRQLDGAGLADRWRRRLALDPEK